MPVESGVYKLKIDGNSPVQLQKQVYIQLRELILAGDMEPGTRLPPSRKLADRLHVSRKTIVSAYDQLIAEGYLTSQTGAGTYVSPNIPEADRYDEDPDTDIIGANQKKRNESQVKTSDIVDEPAPSSEDSLGQLSEYAKRVLAVELMPPRMDHVRFPFFSWQPAFEEIPLTEWSRVVSKTFRRTETGLIDYGSDPIGHLPLRDAIAMRLRKTRGLNCNSNQIIITSGLSQSLDLIARLHVEDGSEILVENPSYWPVRDIFRSYGAGVRSINVDQVGMKTSALSRLTRHNVRAIYVTPSHQFPTGAVLNLSRRLELLNWAKETGAIVIEDDFDSEFRYRGSPIPAMKTLDKEEQVIYLSTFTKVLYPSLAIAFMVVPQKLVPLYARTRWLMGDQTSIQLQEALAEFITSDQLKRHAKRMRHTYALRRKALVEAIEHDLSDCATIYGDPAGLSIMIRVESELADDEILRRASQRGVALTSTRRCYTRNAVQGEFILGYGNLTEEQIVAGVREFRNLLRV